MLLVGSYYRVVIIASPAAVYLPHKRGRSPAYFAQNGSVRSRISELLIFNDVDGKYRAVT
jgi:hypothetical protein